jgi:hypothetical protein
MRRLAIAMVLGLTMLSIGSSDARATCDDVVAVRRHVAATCPCSSTERGRYRKCVAAALRAADVDAACRVEVKRILRRSLCGQNTSAVVCCQVRGKTIGSTARSAAQCREDRGAARCDEASRSSVAGAFFDSVADVCSATGTCNPLPHPCALPGTSVQLTTGVSTATCGRTRNASGSVVRTLACGAIATGGGNATLLDAPVPPDSSLRWTASCAGDRCALTATTTPTTCWDCTGPGCDFGPPLPVRNGGLSMCLVNTLSGASSGTLDRATGDVTDLSLPVSTQLFLVGLERYKRGGGPCPTCSTSVGGPALIGSPTAPAVGVCDGGRDRGQPCRTTNRNGLSRDCRPGGTSASAPCDPTRNANCGDGSANLGVIPLAMAPLSTGASEREAADGRFCPSQLSPGCFAANNAAAGAACRRMEVAGVPAGPLLPGTPAPITMAGLFCIPSTGFPLVNLAADFPGPGAASLVGTLELIER